MTGCPYSAGAGVKIFCHWQGRVTPVQVDTCNQLVPCTKKKSTRVPEYRAVSRVPVNKVFLFSGDLF